MQVNIYLEETDDGGIYGLSAKNELGDNFIFRQYFKTRGEASMQKLVLEDFISFVCEEKSRLIKSKIDDILK